jgi:hypothetical protein
MNRCVPVAILAVILTVCSASAAVISQTQGFVATPAIEKTVAFDRFNPRYGSLDGVEWRFALSVEGGSLTLDNDQPEAQHVQALLGARGSLSSQQVDLITSDQQPLLGDDAPVETSTTLAVDLASDDGDGTGFDSHGSDAATLWGTSTTANLSGWIDPSRIGEYVGTELFDVQVDITTLIAGDSTQVAAELMPPTVAPNLTLIYHFTPVPEPSMVVLGGLGLAVGVFVIRRCRTSSQTNSTS